MIKNYKIFKESLLNEGVVEKTKCNNIAYYVTDKEELKKVYDFAYRNGYSFFGEDTYEPEDLNIKILYLINTRDRTKKLKYNMVYTGGFDKELIYNDYINYWNRDEDLELLVTKSINDIEFALSTFNINDYTKTKRLVYESLLNKLEGPTKDEIESNLKQMYLDGKIDILEWYSKADKFNVEGPNKEQINEYYKKHNPNDILVQSCNVGLLDGVIYALKNNADIDYNFSTPLKNACYYGNLDIVKYLVEQGADYNPYESLAPLYLAIEGMDKDVIDYLFDLYKSQNIITEEDKDDLIRTARKYTDEDTLLYIRKKVENI